MELIMHFLGKIRVNCELTLAYGAAQARRPRFGTDSRPVRRPHSTSTQPHPVQTPTISKYRPLQPMLRGLFQTRTRYSRYCWPVHTLAAGARTGARLPCVVS